MFKQWRFVFLFLLISVLWLGILGNVARNGTRFNPGFPVCNDHSSQNNTTSQCNYRLPVHSLLLLGPPRLTRDQPLKTQKAHASKLFSLGEDSLTSLRKDFTMEFLQPLFIQLWHIGCLRIKKMLSIIFWQITSLLSHLPNLTPVGFVLIHPTSSRSILT